MKKKRYQPYGMPERIKQCIEDSGMNCVSIGEKIGVDRKTMYGYRNGERIPDAYIIAKMCVVFNVSADWIIFGDRNDRDI